MCIGREFDKPALYQIRVKGNLDRKWSDWFDGFAITAQPNDETLLIGTIIDQSALHGLLSTIRDLGLPLLSVMCVDERKDLGQNSQNLTRANGN
jgi:hypothetical protein